MNFRRRRPHDPYRGDYNAVDRGPRVDDDEPRPGHAPRRRGAKPFVVHYWYSQPWQERAALRRELRASAGGCDDSLMATRAIYELLGLHI